MSNIRFRVRNFVKEKICQIYDAATYATLHPQASLKREAHEMTVRFIRSTCPKAVPCRTPRALLDLALSHVSVDGYFLEFGVFKGASLRYVANKPGLAQKRVVGFDSFEGLAEDWVHNRKKTFDVGGRLPKVPANVELVKGYFDQTLAPWMERNDGAVAFLHIDCDLYSSTLTIFDLLKDRFRAGTVIVFDDYFNFPNWEDDGHRVFSDYLRTAPLSARYLGYAFKELAVQLQ
jgi:predicted O-methyltransferase YrrM